MDDKLAQRAEIERKRQRVTPLLILEKRLREVEEKVKRIPLMTKELARLSRKVEKK